MNAQEFISNFSGVKNPILGVRLPEIKIEEKQRKLLGLGEDCSNFDFLRALARKGFLNLKLKKDSKEYLEYAKRTKDELAILNELGFVDYILLVWDVVNFCRENNIPTGPGRGSAAGSLVLFLIGVTKIDSLKYGLYFERFVSKTRAKKTIVDGVTYLDGSLMPDIDIDFDFYQRSKVLAYVDNKYKGKTSKILTLNTLSSKLCIKEVGKILGMKPEEEMTHVTGMIPKLHGIVEDISVAYKDVQEFRDWCNENDLVYSTSLKLSDLIKNKGVHPSGILVSFDLLCDTCPTELSSDKDLVSGYDMGWVSSFAVKLDALGLRSVSVVDDCCQSIGIKPDEINVDDPSIYRYLFDISSPHGLFQLEAETNFRVTQKVKPKDLQELSAVLALARPGALAYVDKYANYTNNQQLEGVHPFFNDVLERTGAICLYQEQAMKMANKMGFTLDEAEQIRRCVTKDTRFVSKQRGWISIEELLDTGFQNDDFLVMDENGKQTWDKIKDIWSNGVHQVRKVETKNGMSIRASRWHQFSTDKGWRARSYLSKNDYLTCALETPFDGADVISKDMAIVIAGLVTEGYFTSYNSCTFTNWDEEIMAKFKACYLREFGIEVTLYKNPRVAFVKREHAKMVNKYLSYGLSASKKLPKELMRLTKESMSEVIGFLYSCEGSFYGSKIEFSSASKDLVAQIQLLLLRYGIRSNINSCFNKKYKRTYYKLFISSYGDQLKFKSSFYQSLSKQKQLDFDREITERDLSLGQECIPEAIVKKFHDQYGFLFNHLGGSCLSSSVSKEKFARTVSGANDLFWSEFCNGKQFYSKVKSFTKETREVEVFDFSMSDQARPYIVAEGILIHNCIGKKKIEEIKSWKTKIYEKIKDQGLDEKIADVFWKILEESGGYQFNFSHSIAYASLSAQTVYLKANYPTQFCLSLLKMAKNEPDPIGEISKISKEMYALGIRLLPPSLTKSKMGFTTEGENIRFGLSSIKGISEKTMEKLNNFKREHANKFELFESSKEAGLGIGVLSALIQAGTLDSISTNRVLMVYEAQLWNLLTEKEKKYVLNYAKDFENSVAKTIKALTHEIKDEKSKFIIKKSRLETIQKNSERYKLIYQQNRVCQDFANWWYENKLLGHTSNIKLIDLFLEKKSTLKPVSEIKTFSAKKRCDFIGIVDEPPKVGKSKNGNAYAKFQISDEVGTLKVMIFKDKLDQCKSLNEGLPKEGDIVIVCGTKMEDDTVFADIIATQQNKIYTRLSELKDV